MNKAAGLGYLPRNSPIHRLSGAAKLLMVVLVSIAAMITYDTRFLLFVIAASFAMFFLSKVKFSELRFIIGFILVFVALNDVFIFLFSPEEGVAIYGTRHEIAHIIGPYYITQEQLFYLLNVTLKYISILPVALIFFVTTEPSEFASSLNKLKVSYKVSYAVALTLRYIPDVRRSYHEISQAQAARGIDTSKKAKLTVRAKNTAAILFPLIFSSLARIETISNAMELRSFGKLNKRTWYAERPFRPADIILIVASALLVVAAILLNIHNGGRFYNPFTT